MAAVDAGRGQEVEARRVGEAGLDAVDALDAAEQPVVVADHLAGILERAGAEIAVELGEALLDRAPEDHEVARRRHLLAVRQAGGVPVDGAEHAELACLAGHAGREIFLAAGDVLGDGRRDVVRRTGHDRLDRVLDGDRLAGPHAELRGGHGGRVTRDLELRIELQVAALDLLEQEVERHHLGDGGGVTQLVLALGVQDAAGIGIDDERGERRRVDAADHLVALRPVVPASLGVGRRQRRGEEADRTRQNGQLGPTRTRRN